MPLKPVCVKCHRFYRLKKSGVSVTEGMPVRNQVQPGLADPGSWVPYKVWHVDLWHCLGCGHEIFAGSGRVPVAVQHEDNFQKTRERLGADRYQVNDC